MGFLSETAAAVSQIEYDSVGSQQDSHVGQHIARQVKNILDVSYRLNQYQALTKKATVVAMRLQLFLYELEDRMSLAHSDTLQGMSLALGDVQSALAGLHAGSVYGASNGLLATGLQAACSMYSAISRVEQFVQGFEVLAGKEMGLQEEVQGLQRKMQGYQAQLAPHCHDLLHICSFVSHEPCSPPELSLLADRVEEALQSVLTDVPLDKQALTDELKVLPLKREQPLVTLPPGSLPHLVPLLPVTPPGSTGKLITEASTTSQDREPHSLTSDSAQASRNSGTEECSVFHAALRASGNSQISAESHTSAGSQTSQFSSTLAAWRQYEQDLVGTTDTAAGREPSTHSDRHHAQHVTQHAQHPQANLPRVHSKSPHKTRAGSESPHKLLNTHMFGWAEARGLGEGGTAQHRTGSTGQNSTAQQPRSGQQNIPPGPQAVHPQNTIDITALPISMVDNITDVSGIFGNIAPASSNVLLPKLLYPLEDLNHLSPFTAFAHQLPGTLHLHPSLSPATLSPSLLACFDRSAAPAHTSCQPRGPIVTQPTPSNHTHPSDACTMARPPSQPGSPPRTTHDLPHYMSQLPCSPPVCHGPPRSPIPNCLTPLSKADAGFAPAPLPLPDATVHLRTVKEANPRYPLGLPSSGVKHVDMDTEISQWGPCLGRGGYGRVYKAVYRERAVAVKLLRGAPGDEEDLRALEAEIMHLSQLLHPNIVQVYACSITPPDLCIVQELMEFDLYDYIHRQCQGMVSLLHCLDIGHQIALGLRELHPHVVHRDLKPANVLLDRRLHVKIADFGLARTKRSQYLSTQRHDVGTIKYMAPECFLNANVSERADIYSFGVLMFECLSGREPWEGLHPLCAMFQVDRGHKLELPSDPTQCPPRLRRLVEGCWTANQKERPSAQLLVQELEGMLKACKTGRMKELD